MYEIMQRPTVAICVHYPNKETELFSLKQIVQETYTGQGVYIVDGSNLLFGTENGKAFWTFDPKMGRMQYLFDGTYLYVTKHIKIPVRLLKGKYWYGFDSGEERGFDTLEDLIVHYYLTTPFTRTKEKDMTFEFGCRKYGDYLELL